MGLLSGQVAVITGGGRGIGRAIAERYARDGATIVVSSRTASDLDEVATQARSQGSDGIAVVADAMSRDDARRPVIEALARFGRVDVLVNNAGGQFRAPIKKISPRGFEAVVRNNLIGGYIFMREVYARWMVSK